MRFRGEWIILFSLLPLLHRMINGQLPIFNLPSNNKITRQELLEQMKLQPRVFSESRTIPLLLWLVPGYH